MSAGLRARGRRPGAVIREGLPPALRYPPFVRLWAGSILSSVGTQMSNVAKLWVLYLLTHSALALGIEGLCFSVPIMVLPLLAGPVSDRVDRRTIVKITTAAEAGEAAALAVIAAAGALHPWVIYLTAVLEAGRLAVDIPARTALTTSLVPGAALLSAQSLSAVVWSSAALAGPALGGLLLAATSATVVFAVNAVTTIAALLAFLPLSRAALHAASRAETPAGLASGLRFGWRHRELRDLEIILLATSTLILGTETLLPVLDQALWHGGAAGYGLLRMAPGIAAVLAGATLSVLRAARSPARVITVSVLTACAGLIGFTWAPGLAIAFILLALASLALTAAQVNLLTRIQLLTPDRLRGAVSGFSVIAQSGLSGVVAACMALVAAGLGARAVIAAVAVLAAGLTVCAARRATRR